MKLYLARHGKTNYNELGLCNGDPNVDVHLTKVGAAQALTLGEKLAPATINQIYISELPRTLQTAEIVNKSHHAQVTVDARLNDIRTGFEGKHFSEYFAALDKAENRWTASFNNGESVEDFKKRVRSFLDDLRNKNEATPLIVTSEVVVQTIYGLLHNLSNSETWKFQVEQGGYITVDLDI